MKIKTIRKVAVIIMGIGTLLTFVGYYRMYLTYIGLSVLAVGFFVAIRSEKNPAKEAEKKRKKFYHYFYFKM